MPKSKNYYWNSESLLGSGAVGEVYKGYHLVSFSCRLPKSSVLNVVFYYLFDFVLDPGMILLYLKSNSQIFIISFVASDVFNF